MKKLLTGLFFTCGFIGLLAVSFIFYAQFALDYSLENLREALALSSETQAADPAGVGSRAVGAGFEGMVLEEISGKDADLETVVLLEHASRSLREAIQQSGYTQAGVYLTEVLKDRASGRSAVLRITDSVYHIFKNLIQSFKDFLTHLLRGIHRPPEEPPLAQTGVLILAEAEKMEKAWKLGEAERYYREFLDRYSGRPERGFVKISLAHILTKQQRLKEAHEILTEVRQEFQGGRESSIASNLMKNLTAIQKRLNRIPELENWIKSAPDRLFTEEGGLELALSHLATYQLDQALEILEKLSESPDPRLRTKSLFYKGWIYKWKGDLDQGQALFQLLQKETHLDKKLESAVTAQIAEVHYEKKEYKEAVAVYEELSRKAAGEAWRALSELERGSIYVFRLGEVETARKQLEQLKAFFPAESAGLEVIRKKFEEVLEKGRRNEAFKALSQGRVDRALKILEEYLKKYPRDGTAQSGLASIFLIQGDLEEAMERASRGFELERTEYTATVLGYVHEKMTHLKEAIQYYGIALEIKSNYLTARFNLSWVYIKMGKYKDADALLSDLENERSRLATIIQAKILNNRGCALWGLGRREEALVRFKEALKVLPDFAEARSNLTLTTGERPVAVAI